MILIQLNPTLSQTITQPKRFKKQDILNTYHGNKELSRLMNHLLLKTCKSKSIISWAKVLEELNHQQESKPKPTAICF